MEIVGVFGSEKARFILGLFNAFYTANFKWSFEATSERLIVFLLLSVIQLIFVFFIFIFIFFTMANSNK
jgi:hypothetical protein